jgi:type III pantothenate kinase
VKRAAIDIGNTKIKTAIFSETGEILSIQLHDDLKSTIEYLHELKVKSVICSSVAAESEKELEQSDFQYHILNYKSKIPFNNLYQSPETLGTDRIAALAAAVQYHPKKNVLIFDIGTCMTIDFVDAHGNYNGGNISPGLNMRLQAMYHFTHRLPETKVEANNGLMGLTTKQAIANGALHGLQFEIEGYAQKFASLYTDLTIVLCGGYTEYFDKQHKFEIFADQNFVLKGLYHLLLLNEK